MSACIGVASQIIPPPHVDNIEYVVDNEMANYIISQLNRFPDNGFKELTEQYGTPVWEASYVEGWYENERLIIPFMKNNRVETMVRYNTPDGNTLETPIVINQEYINQTDFMDQYYSSLRFYKLKQKGYCIGNNLDEVALDLLAAPRAIPKASIKENRARLKSTEYDEVFGPVFELTYDIPRWTYDGCSMDLSTYRMTQCVQDAARRMNFGEEIFVWDYCTADAYGAYIYFHCLEEAKEEDFLYEDYLGMILYYIRDEVARSYNDCNGGFWTANNIPIYGAYYLRDDVCFYNNNP